MPINTRVEGIYVHMTYLGTFDGNTNESDIDVVMQFERQPYCDAILAARETGFGRVEYGKSMLQLKEDPHKGESPTYLARIEDGPHSQDIWGVTLDKFVPAGITLDALLQVRELV